MALVVVWSKKTSQAIELSAAEGLSVAQQHSAPRCSR